MTTEARILHELIAAPFDRAYAFAQTPESFMRWAAGLATTLHRRGDAWVADTPEGEAVVTFSAPNDHGVLDHRVALPGRPEVSVPLRMIAAGEGTTLVELVLFRQPDMSDADFKRDAQAVRADLRRLKAVLEGRG